MTLKQARELDVHVRKGEKGIPFVYSNIFVRTGTNEVSGSNIDLTIPIKQGYTVSSVGRIEGLSAQHCVIASAAAHTQRAVNFLHSRPKVDRATARSAFIRR
jgi:antirestriction protein ArdC